MSKLKDLLKEVTPRMGLGVAESGVIWARWAEIVGDQIAGQAEPTSLRHGVLRVRTTSPTWATEIGYLSEQIRTRANEVAGRALVTEVRVWTGPGPVRSAPVGAGKRGSVATSEEPPVRPRYESPQEALEAARSAQSAHRPRR
jgi:hypothetical protein